MEEEAIGNHGSDRKEPEIKTERGQDGYDYPMKQDDPPGMELYGEIVIPADHGQPVQVPPVQGDEGVQFQKKLSARRLGDKDI